MNSRKILINFINWTITGYDDIIYDIEKLMKYSRLEVHID